MFNSVDNTWVPTTDCLTNRPMEWSKEKTLKLIELLQHNAPLWNPSLCDTRRDKQKRREELRLISDLLGVTIPDVSKKIQHLRTQYNRECSRETRFNAKEPNYNYVSNWYAFEYLHFMKDSSKPYRVFQTDSNAEVNSSVNSNDATGPAENNIASDPPEHKVRTDIFQNFKPEILYTPGSINRDEFTVFGEYIANELRSLKGERNLLIAKKKIQDVIFEVKMGMISDQREQGSTCTVYTHSSQPPNATTIHSGKIFTTPVMSTIANIEQLNNSHTPPTSGISEIIINGACHYTNFKVDTQ